MTRANQVHYRQVRFLGRFSNACLHCSDLSSASRRYALPTAINSWRDENAGIDSLLLTLDAQPRLRFQSDGIGQSFDRREVIRRLLESRMPEVKATVLNLFSGVPFLPSHGANPAASRIHLSLQERYKDMAQLNRFHPDRRNPPAAESVAPVREIDALKDSRWAEFIEGHPRACAFHSIGWLKALKVSYGYDPFVLTTAQPGEALKDGIGSLAGSELAHWSENCVSAFLGSLRSLGRRREDPDAADKPRPAVSGGGEVEIH